MLHSKICQIHVHYSITAISHKKMGMGMAPEGKHRKRVSLLRRGHGTAGSSWVSTWAELLKVCVKCMSFTKGSMLVFVCEYLQLPLVFLNCESLCFYDFPTTGSNWTSRHPCAYIRPKSTAHNKSLYPWSWSVLSLMWIVVSLIWRTNWRWSVCGWCLGLSGNVAWERGGQTELEAGAQRWRMVGGAAEPYMQEEGRRSWSLEHRDEEWLGQQ